MTALYALLLGTIQGLSEFLPISSSGHLILARACFGWEGEGLGLAFDVACHVGTLAAIVAYFWRDLVRLVVAAPRTLRLDGGIDSALSWIIVLGTVPIVVVGLLAADAIEASARTPWIVLAALVLGAFALLAAERIGRQTRDEHTLTWWEALLFGGAQALALVPGVSRSGATITAGLCMGLTRPGAARLSFLLGVPAMVAAGAREGLVVVRQGLTANEAVVFAIGMGSSAIVGYLTVRFLLRFLVGHRLDVFAYYRLAVAAGAAFWLYAR